MKTYYEDFCRQFYSMLSVPITYANPADREFCTYPEGYGELNPLTPELTALFHLQKNPDYHITQSFCYFGTVKLEQSDAYFIIGPVSSTPISKESIDSFMHEFCVPPQNREQIAALLASTPCISFQQFLNILSFMHLCLNQKMLDIIKHFEIAESTGQKKFREIIPKTCTMQRKINPSTILFNLSSNF